MRRRNTLLFVFVLAAPVSTGAAFAQTPAPGTIALRLDNDAFDFWRPPWNRPDEEYTSGVHITYDGGPAPWWSAWTRWSRGFLSEGPSCTYGVRRCRTARLEIGQDIYTPSLAPGDSAPVPGSRPSAGWLYVSQTARALAERRSDELTFTLGVTGDPSLAQVTQRLAHDIAPAFNRPTDWSREIAFEPGLMARYEQRRRLAILGGPMLGADFIPRLAITAGNVAASAELGGEGRVGWHLRHPWLPEEGPFEFALTSGAGTRLVVRDLFLDGNTFRSGPRVGHEPLVASGTLGLQARYRAVSVSYRAESDSRAYAGGPKWHPWASIVGGLTFDR